MSCSLEWGTLAVIEQAGGLSKFLGPGASKWLGPLGAVVGVFSLQRRNGEAEEHQEE